MTDENLQRAEPTRDRIIQTAHELFIRQGYHGTSMRQIAQNAEVALGGIYNHFSCKEDIFRAVFLRYHPYQEVLPALMKAEGSSIDEFVRDAFKHMVIAVEKRLDFANLMFIEIVEFNSAHTVELFAELLPQQMQIVRRLVASGPDRLRHIPPLILLRSFLGMFFGYILSEIIMAADAPDEFRENAVDYFVDIYLHGILRDV